VIVVVVIPAGGESRTDAAVERRQRCQPAGVLPPPLGSVLDPLR
jgi:hypothetical protein